VLRAWLGRGGRRLCSGARGHGVAIVIDLCQHCAVVLCLILSQQGRYFAQFLGGLPEHLDLLA